MATLRAYHPYAELGYFSFSASDNVKVLGIEVTSREGLVIYYLDQGYGAKTIQGYISKLDESLDDNYQFIGATNNRCVFILKDPTIQSIDQNVVSEIIFQIEQRIPVGTASTLVESLRQQLYNEGDWIQKIIARLQTEELRKTQESLVQTQSALILEYNKLAEELRQKASVLSQIEFLSKELGYQKEFVDKHPF